MQKHIEAAKTVLRGLEKIGEEDWDAFEPKMSFPSNKTFENQHRFCSTKKEPMYKTKRLTKLSSKDCKVAREDLNAIETNFCAICFKEDDKDSGDNVEWTECPVCYCWMHKACKPNFSAEEFYAPPVLHVWTKVRHL